MSRITTMTPKEIVHELDRYVIGQQQAKRAVAIALRNRSRRMLLEDELRSEVCPNNILMIGSTGVGKTEIARRLARLMDAPFIKVEATKFTEVGYVGRDVETIVRDLMDVAVRNAKQKAYKQVSMQAQEAVELLMVEALMKKDKENNKKKKNSKGQIQSEQWYLKSLREGKFNDDFVEIETSSPSHVGVEIVSPPGMEEMTDQLQHLFQNLGSDKVKLRKMTVEDAQKLLLDEESSRMVNEDEIRDDALRSVEQNGIVFIDEIDKVIKAGRGYGGEVSREGVQRDLLPLIEGTTVNTRYGMVNTQHMLFIASGAFLQTKPSDMISELQGRLPIRVELKDLTVDDFERILVEPKASLITQYKALLATEGVDLQISKKVIRRLAEIAFQLNQSTDNIGARRLHMVMEKSLETIAFHAEELEGTKVVLKEKDIEQAFEKLLHKQDLARWVL